jgi:hypothetical protein
MIPKDYLTFLNKIYKTASRGPQRSPTSWTHPAIENRITLWSLIQIEKTPGVLRRVGDIGGSQARAFVRRRIRMCVSILNP